MILVSKIVKILCRKQKGTLITTGRVVRALLIKHFTGDNNLM